MKEQKKVPKMASKVLSLLFQEGWLEMNVQGPVDPAAAEGRSIVDPGRRI